MGIFRHIVICLAIICAASTGAYGQISGVGSDKDTVASYPAGDPIFVFNQYPSSKPGKLQANNPAKDTATFVWSRYDTTSFSFSSPIKIESGTISSVKDTLTQGGYKVTIKSSGNPDKSYMAWVFLNNFTMNLNKKYMNTSRYRHCSYIDVLDTSLFSNFTYYDTADVSHKKQILANKLTFTWSAPSLSFPISSADISDGTYTSHLRIGGNPKSPKVKPPAKDTWFTLNVTDKFKLTIKDSLLYQTIQTEPHFRMVYKLTYDTASAPLAVTFVNSSVNAKAYQWFFPGSTPDTATVMTRDSLKHMYYEPKTYYIKLITTSPYYCNDSIKDSIKVAKAYIGVDSIGARATKVPNVFDPSLRWFKVDLVSIKEFHITIFSRWGRIVYEYDGPVLSEWEGWDGKIKGSDASQGLYYYIIKAKTWDSTPIPTYINANGEYKNYFYLFRQN